MPTTSAADAFPFPLTRARLSGWVQAPRASHANLPRSLSPNAAAALIDPPQTSAHARHERSPSATLDARDHPAGMLSPAILNGTGPLAQLMRENALYPVYQPIASLGNGAIHAHEALIRGPKSTPLHTPDALLDAARREDLLLEFELFCVIAAVQRWGAFNEPGRLFVNISAAALVQAITQQGGRSDPFDFVRQTGVLPRMLVLELTEHERVTDMGALAEVAAEVRAAGVSLALDDFGDGRSSLRLWSQIKPEIVKIDKYFTKNISNHAENLQTLQAIKQIAAIFGSELVAEGIETQEDLRVLRDLNIAYGQGYFLGRPAPLPRAEVEAAASLALQDRSVAVFPELERAACP
jgi:EAL domain-containing protein (putative c-di-GMP-specific phosphodiesterase class I)